MKALGSRLWLRMKQRYGSALREFIHWSFPWCERLGFHLTLNHYYEPVPELRTLRDELWSRPSELVGLAMDERKQLDLLAQFAQRYRAEYDAFPREQPASAHGFWLNNTGFQSVDAEVLYCMIRQARPARVYEIGSGNSTALAARALLKNQEDDGRLGELTAIEPWPNGILKAGFPGLSRLIQRPVQEVPVEAFMQLGPNDILFIDSSHTLKIGSDVQYEYLEILPRLRQGVLIHVHDIHFPSDYPKGLIMESHRFWNEQYLVQAFLAFNDSFEILWAGSYLHLRHPEALEAAFRSYDRHRHWPSSLWLRRKP